MAHDGNHRSLKKNHDIPCLFTKALLTTTNQFSYCMLSLYILGAVNPKLTLNHSTSNQTHCSGVVLKCSYIITSLRLVFFWVASYPFSCYNPLEKSLEPYPYPIPLCRLVNMNSHDRLYTIIPNKPIVCIPIKPINRGIHQPWFRNLQIYLQLKHLITIFKKNINKWVFLCMVNLWLIYG
jgi:hypothetical protein